MGVLHGIERRLQGAVDYSFTRLFGGGVQPAEVTGALQDEAARHLTREGSRTIAPNHFLVRLGPSDSSAVGDDADRVAAAFSAMIGRYVDEHGWDTYGDVSVILDQSDVLHTGQFRISSQIDPDAAPDRAPAAADASPPMTRSAGSGRDGDASLPGAPDAPRYGTRVDSSPGRPPLSDASPSGPSFGYSPPGPSGPAGGFGGTGEPYGGYPPSAQPYPDQAHFNQPYADRPYAGYAPVQPPPAPARPGRRKAFLTVQDGSGRTVTLLKGSNVIGRGQGAALRLVDSSVSRRHADVYFDGQVAIVHDLGSTNGTAVNGSPVQTWQLADGDVIELGRCTLIAAVR